MPGLIEQILKLGAERPELVKDHHGAPVGGARVPFPPKDMASVVSVLKGISIKHYLALEVETQGAVDVLSANLHPEKILRVTDLEEKQLRRLLRLTPAVDLISLDGRGLPLDAETVWRYIEGGKDAPKPTFGQGAPTDYGAPLLRPGGALVVNLADPGAREVWFKARVRHNKMFQSPFVGVVRVAST